MLINVAALSITLGALILAFTAGRLHQLLKEATMPTESNIKLAGAVASLLTAYDAVVVERDALKAELAKPNPSDVALAEEANAEDAITASIAAKLPPAPAPAPAPEQPAQPAAEPVAAAADPAAAPVAQPAAAPAQ